MYNGDIYGPRGKLKPTKMKIGYLSVTLSISKGIVQRKYVHKLVADNFLRNKNKGYVVNHIDEKHPVVKKLKLDENQIKKRRVDEGISY